MPEKTTIIQSFYGSYEFKFLLYNNIKTQLKKFYVTGCAKTTVSTTFLSFLFLFLWHKKKDEIQLEMTLRYVKWLFEEK